MTEIVDEQMSETHLCEECARQKSSQMEQQFGLADLLAGLSEAGKPSSAKSAEEKSALKCSTCGLNYEDFRKFGRLGCGDCYVSFKEHLTGLLRKIHGSNRHLGKMPLSLVKGGPGTGKGVATAPAGLLSSESIEDLKRQLYAAIEDEDFEKAATLRDKIRTMERG